MRPISLKSLLLLAASLLAIQPVPKSIVAQELSAATIANIDVGFGGVLKAGYWTPVRVSITAGSAGVIGRLTVTTPDGDGVDVHYDDASDDVQLASGETGTFVRYVKIGRFNTQTRQVRGDLTVQLISADRVVSSAEWNASATTKVLASDREWIISLGPTIGVAESLPQTVVTAMDDFADLPTSWYGYEGLDAVVVSTSDLESISRIQPDQIAAIHEWVLLGGRFVMCVGSRGDEILASGSPLARLAPGQLSRVLDVRSLTALETYAGTSQAIDAIEVDRSKPRLTISLLKDVRGKLSVYDQTAEGKRPIVVRAPTGLGQVIFVAVDLDQPPFSLWEGRTRFVEKLLRGDDLKQDRGSDRQRAGQVVHLGYNDLVGQLRTALDQFSGAQLVSFSWVAGLLVVYILLIGPGDYFLLKDGLKRLHWTWLTFPAIVVAFSVSAIVLHQRYKPAQVKVNQVDLVDIDTSASIVRGTSWVHIYSPRTAAYDLRVTSALTAPGNSQGGGLLSWQGLPGTGLGGLQANSAALFSTSYAIRGDDSRDAIERAPVHIDGTRVLSSRWWSHAAFESATQLRVDKDGLLRGTLANPLPFQLSDCMLMYDNCVYRLDRKAGVLNAGDATQIELEKALNLTWRLTRRRVVDIRDVTTPWDPRDMDVPRIVEAMMFHRAAGGDDYTHLRHRYQNYLDLTEHLAMGRAILLGRAERPANELHIDGERVTDNYDQHWAFYRIAFPVERLSEN